MPAQLDITIPVLNEAETLRVQVEKVLAYIDQKSFGALQITIVIADNGSKDATPEIGKKLENDFPGRVRFLRVPSRGVGLALKTSWNATNADFVGYFDLDLSTDMVHLDQVIALLLGGKPALICGTRLAKNAKVIGRSPAREITSRCFNLLLKLYFHIKFSDGMCGFKFMPRAVWEKLRQGPADSDGWFFATELQIYAENRNVEIVEIPVRWTQGAQSKVRIAALSWEYLKAMRRLKRRLPAKAGT